jgi:hypothetical protein
VAERRPTMREWLRRLRRRPPAPRPAWPVGHLTHAQEIELIDAQRRQLREEQGWINPSDWVANRGRHW